MNFYDVAAQQRWTPETQVAVLLEYINRQDSNEAFDDFLREMVIGDAINEGIDAAEEDINEEV